MESVKRLSAEEWLAEVARLNENTARINETSNQLLKSASEGLKAADRFNRWSIVFLVGSAVFNLIAITALMCS